MIGSGGLEELASEFDAANRIQSDALSKFKDALVGPLGVIPLDKYPVTIIAAYERYQPNKPNGMMLPIGLPNSNFMAILHVPGLP